MKRLLLTLGIGLLASCESEPPPTTLKPLVTTSVPAPPYTGTRPDTYDENYDRDQDMRENCTAYEGDDHPDIEDWNCDDAEDERG